MRTWILVLLGGGALYFAWTRYGGVDAADAPDGNAEVEFPVVDQDRPGGALSSLADLQAAAAAAPQEAAEAARSGAELAPTEAGQGPDAEADDLDGLDLNALGDPLYEGSLLVHHPEELQGYLNEAGKHLSKARRKLLIAYLLLARGQHGQVPRYAEGLDEAPDITDDELALLRRGLDRQRIELLDAGGRPWSNPLILGASMAMVERDADEAAIASNWRRAAERLSELLLVELDAPWEPGHETLQRWATALEEAQASHRWSPDGEWPSVEVVVEPGDTLIGIRARLIAERPNLTLCTGMIERANRLGKYLREGQRLRVPTDRVRTLVDLSARWLYYMHGNEVVAAWRVATGREGQETTIGRYPVGEKTPEPPWFPKGRIVAYGDPENPLGTRWIGLEDSDGLGIHGTWEPSTIGQMASDGCIRLLNADVEELFEIIPRGSEVIIRP